MTLAALDYETKASYSVMVTATDPHDLSATTTVTITVTNVDEPGTVTLSSMQPVLGAALTARVEDPDGMVTVETWQWASSDTSGGTYTNISGAMSASYTPVEADEGYYLKATARYTDGHGSGKSASGMTTMTAVQVTFAISGMSDSSYMENGTDAVGTYIASGPEAASATWMREGADAGDFMVEGSGASVMLKFSSPPDYENAGDSGTDNTYQVTLKATAGTNMATPRRDRRGHQRGRTWDAVRGFKPQLHGERRRRRGDLHGLGRLDVGRGQLVADGRRHGRLEHQQQRYAHLRCNAQLRDAYGRGHGQHLHGHRYG